MAAQRFILLCVAILGASCSAQAARQLLAPAPAPWGSAEGPYYCPVLPAAQAACGQQAFASYTATTPSDAWLTAIMQGAVDKYNSDMSENWRRLTCSPKDDARLVCYNKWSPDQHVLVFDADCGEAGTVTLQAYVGAEDTGVSPTVSYYGLVNALCQPAQA